jgi:hypothetical protein
MTATTRPDSTGPYHAEKMSPAEEPCPQAISALTQATAKTTRSGGGGPCPSRDGKTQGTTAPQAIVSSGNSTVMSGPKARFRATVGPPRPVTRS